MADSSLPGGASLGTDDRARLQRVAQRRKFRAGEIVFHEGDPGDTIMLIDKGHVVIRATTPLGDSAAFVVLGPGDVFGEGSLLAPDARRSASAQAIGATEIRTVHKRDFDELRKECATIDRFLIDVLAGQVRRLSGHLMEALYVPVDTRVMRRLLGLAELFGRGDLSATIPMTQDDVASLAGTTRPTVNRVLKQAEHDGVIALSRGKVEVLDLDRLRKLAR